MISTQIQHHNPKQENSQTKNTADSTTWVFTQKSSTIKPLKIKITEHTLNPYAWFSRDTYTQLGTVVQIST
jgi:hypothetical protein